MAFDTTQLFNVNGMPPGYAKYVYLENDDAIATVIASGYFNNTDDNQNLAADDEIEVRGDLGVYTLKVTAVSSGTVTTDVVKRLEKVETGATSANLSNHGLSRIGATAASTFQLDAPEGAGVVKRIFCTDAGTGITLTVNMGTGNIGVVGTATGVALTFNAVGESVILVSTSTTSWDILANTGSVGLA